MSLTLCDSLPSERLRGEEETPTRTISRASRSHQQTAVADEWARVPHDSGLEESYRSPPAVFFLVSSCKRFNYASPNNTTEAVLTPFLAQGS